MASAAERQQEKTLDRDLSEGRERLGGARADFVANLGRRRVEMRTTLDVLREDPTSKRFRDEIRRRIHALAAGAKLLRFPRLAAELKVVETRLDEAAQRGTFEDGDFGAVHDLLGRMTTLAWSQTEEGDPAQVSVNDGMQRLRESTKAEQPRAPISVLVVGAGSLADALTMPQGRAADADSQSFEVERTSDVAVAIDLARALAPDVAVIDGDAPRAKEAIESLLADPLTDNIPVIVCLKVVRADDAGPLLALGVARVLPKPVSPGELRRACAGAVATYVRREIVREPLGEINLDQLGARLAEELRRGLCDTVDPSVRTAPIKLGEGTELLAALWGAVARIRDVVTIKTRGEVRFALGGPEGAVPLAPWLEGGDVSSDHSKRSTTARLSRADAEGSLEKTRILVADDDAAVCWFLAGVLKTAGATVYEARDGERAFEIAKHMNPDLVISDILMPKLDGFALSRALRRDISLRDVPIVLLSWKEDLLQRVRELGADADGYLRKEASAGSIVQRVRELVRQKQRVAQRIAAQGEVRGRLDGLTTHTLLRLVCQLRENSTVAVRDASYLYEVEIRKGKPVRATRTALSGAFERGSSVMSALLGVGDGRFSVSPPREDAEVGPVRAELTGSLAEQIMPVVASARAAQRLLTGESLMRVRKVEIDEDAILGYWGATPENARDIVTSVAGGMAPRDLVTSGRASARLLEDVLLDAAVHGAVVQVIDGSNEDRLPDATSVELALLRGERAGTPIAGLPVLAIPAALPATPSPAPLMDVAMPASNDLLKMALQPQATFEPSATIDDCNDAFARPSATLFAGTPATVIDAAGNFSPFANAASAAAPESPLPAPALDEPVMLAPHAAAGPSDADLDRRSNAALDQLADAIAPSMYDPWFGGPLLDSPIDAIESAPPSSGKRTLTPPPKLATPRPPSPKPSKVSAKEDPDVDLRSNRARELTPTPSHMPPPPGLKPMLTLGSLHPPPVSESVPTPRPKNVKKSPPPSAVASKDGAESKNDLTPKFPLPSAYLPYTQPEKKKDRKTVYWVLFALAGIGFALWARHAREKAIVNESAVIAEMAPAVEQTPQQKAAAAAAGPSRAPSPSRMARRSSPARRSSKMRSRKSCRYAKASTSRRATACSRSSQARATPSTSTASRSARARW